MDPARELFFLLLSKRQILTSKWWSEAGGPEPPNDRSEELAGEQAVFVFALEVRS
jgi:hypothetical protein